MNSGNSNRKTLTLGSRRELFVDDLLVDRLRRASLVMHQPVPREVVFCHDAPWEGTLALYHTLVHAGGRYLLYYRGWEQPTGAVYCVAESPDGIRFRRPRLGLHEHNGRRDNNIILASEPFTHTFAPFLDTRPGVDPAARFKAFSRNKLSEDEARRRGLRADPVSGKFRTSVLNGFASADGIRWRLLSDEPIITDGAFDSQNVGFWSEAEGVYVAFYRTFVSPESFAAGKTAPTTAARRLRAIMRATSDDFLHWRPGVLMDYRRGGRPAPAEEFYINQTRPYFRAPHIYLALPARFMAGRRALAPRAAAATGVLPGQREACSDACLMAARPGRHWYERTFMEAFIRPLPGDAHWTARSNYPVDGLAQTGPDELSLYVAEHYAQPANRVRRYTLRLDGFASVRAPAEGGQLLTRPLLFSGRSLELNYATGAAGSLRVEIQDENGVPLPGYRLREAHDIFGNRVAGRAAWRHGTEVGPLAGRPVRLRFVMRDADLYSLRFTADPGAA